MAELGQRACHVRRFDPLILNDFIMKPYEEIIQRTADFDYMMRTQLPEKYMPEVFGVTAGEDPDLRQLLHNASRNGIGITYLLFKIILKSSHHENERNRHHDRNRRPEHEIDRFALH